MFETLELLALGLLISFSEKTRYVSPFFSVIAGLSVVYALTTDNNEKPIAARFWQGLLVVGLLFGAVAWVCLPKIGISMPQWQLWGHVVGGVAGLVLAFSWGRYVVPKLSRVKAKATRRSEMERNRKTDVREIDRHLPDPRKDFDPSKYLDAKRGVFLGLDENGKPLYIPQDRWQRSHVQLIGTSGAGKGVAATVLLSQALRDGEAVVVIDPKDDEWAPHVLRAEAKRLGVPFALVDLRADAPQLDLFDGANSDQLEELLVAGFSLSERGEAADFYRIADRQTARLAGSLLDELGDGATPQLLAAHPDIRKAKQDAAGFVGKLDELARVSALDAPFARHLSATVRDGGCLYIIGSMRNERIKCAQRMALVRLLQLVETRDRIGSKPRPVCVFLDELKYHLSRPALEGLGAARDKGMHLVLAHQSLADLRDCPADLDGDAVVGAVVENCTIRIAYRVQDPVTALWLATMTGEILVDDEVRKVERNAALAEVMDAERTVKQAGRPLVDVNMLLNLPNRVAVLYGGKLPVFAHICPVHAAKGPLELAVMPQPEPEPFELPDAPPPFQDEAPWPEGCTTEPPAAAKKKRTNPRQLEELPDVDI